MKKIIITSILVVGLAAGFAYAGGRGCGNMGGNGGMGYGMMSGGMMGGGQFNCPYNQEGWDSKTQQKFLNDTVELRRVMHQKQFEYMEAQRSPNTTGEQLAELEKQMTELRLKLRNAAK